MMSTDLATRTHELRTAALSRLNICPYRDVRELRIKITDDGRLRIRGAVYSFYHKQLAQELLRPLADVERLRIINEAEVFDALTD